METIINQLLARVFALFPVLALLANVKGGFVGLEWESTLKVRAPFKGTLVRKHVRCIGRVGIAHDNRAKVIEARANGDLPSVNQGLPWGEWLLAPWFITHKGKLYVRVYPVEGTTPHSTYTANGKPIAKSEALLLCLASEFSKIDAAIGCFTVNAENLTSVRYGETRVDIESPVAPAGPDERYELRNANPNAPFPIGKSKVFPWEDAQDYHARVNGSTDHGSD